MLSHRKGIGALLLATLTIAAMLASPIIHAQYQTRYVKSFINWNGVFREGLDSIQRSNVIAKLEGEIAAVSAKPVDSVKPAKGKICRYILRQLKEKKIARSRFVVKKITTKYCSCNDTLLWNIRADVEMDRDWESSDGSQPGVVPPKPPLKPVGEPIAILENNDSVKFSERNTLPTSGVSEYNKQARFADSSVIAVLDTGIDTSFFDPALRSRMFWNGPSGSRNMLFGADVMNYNDDYRYKHGTSVANLAINSFYQASDSTLLPKLMVLKVLDSNATGSVFEFCCGLSYAMENHATVINASLGYYGPSDVVLDHYVKKCHNDSIPIVAAAGNADEIATVDRVCSPDVRPENMLRSPGRYFLPASYAAQTDRYSVISVTGMPQPGVPCYFQNYSSQFVTLGVFNQKTEGKCCMYVLPFIDPGNALEGTSFATPVVSGRLALGIHRLGHFSDMQTYKRIMNVANAPVIGQAVTMENQYITY